MEKNRDSMMQTLKFEVLHMEKKNLRSKAKTDQRMSEELQKIIKEYARRDNGIGGQVYEV